MIVIFWALLAIEIVARWAAGLCLLGFFFSIYHDEDIVACHFIGGAIFSMLIVIDVGMIRIHRKWLRPTGGGASVGGSTGNIPMGSPTGVVK